MLPDPSVATVTAVPLIVTITVLEVASSVLPDTVTMVLLVISLSAGAVMELLVQLLTVQSFPG